LRAFAHQDKTVCRRSMQRVLWHDSHFGRCVEALWTNPDAMTSRGEDAPRMAIAHVVRIAPPTCRATRTERPWSSSDTTQGFDGIPRFSGDALAGEVELASSARRLLAAGLLRLSRWRHRRSPRRFAAHGFDRSRIRQQASILRDFIEHNNPEQTDLRDFAQQFRQSLAGPGQLRVGHGDMKGHEFIVDPENRIWLIDLGWPARVSITLMLHRNGEET